MKKLVQVENVENRMTPSEKVVYGHLIVSQ